jgi:hypothetical protein
MDFDAWMHFFGTSQDDPQLKAALAAAGIKKVPKRRNSSDMSIQFELKGHGLEIIMTDESVLKDLDDQDLGEGPLIMSGVFAKVSKAFGRDVYAGKLPLGLARDMSQAAIRKILGKPTLSETDMDIWENKKREIAIHYEDGTQSLYTVTVTLPGVEF